MITLCEECFPDWGHYEVLTIGRMFGTCKESGGRSSKMRTHTFASDPINIEMAILLQLIDDLSNSSFDGRCV